MLGYVFYVKFLYQGLYGGKKRKNFRENSFNENT
jgi:hypothetical protein